MSSSRSPILPCVQRLLNFLQLLQILLGSTISVSFTIPICKRSLLLPIFLFHKISQYLLLFNCFFQFCILSQASIFLHLLNPLQSPSSPQRLNIPIQISSATNLQILPIPVTFLPGHKVILTSFRALIPSIFAISCRILFYVYIPPPSFPTNYNPLSTLYGIPLLLLPLHYFKRSLLFFCYISPSRLTPYFLLLPPYHQMADIMSSYPLSRPFSLQTFTIQSSRYRWSLCHASFPVYIGFLT